MTVVAWRIATEAPLYAADALCGTGAKHSGGRWNRKGNAVVYASTSIALACLETVIHLGAIGLPMNRYLVRITIPGALWSARTEWTPDTLPVGWDAEPAGQTSLDIGDTWLRTAPSAIARLPSVVVPEEFNILINPAHPDASAVRAEKVRKWLYDPRLWQGGESSSGKKSI